MRRIGVLLLLAPLLLASGCSSDSPDAEAQGASWMIAMNGDFTTESIDGRTYLLIESPSDTKLFTERPVRSALPVTPETVVAMWPIFGFADVPPNSAVMVEGEPPVIVTLNNPAWTSTDAIRIEVVNDANITIDGPGSVVIDASNPVNGQVTDSITQTNTKILGDAPAQAMGGLYQSIGNSIAVAAQNATNAQQNDMANTIVIPTIQGALEILKITGGQGNPGAQTPTN